MLTRKLLAIVAGLALGYAIPALFLVGPTDFGVGVAIAAAAWCAIGCVRYVQRGRDRARHPSVWSAR